VRVTTVPDVSLVREKSHADVFLVCGQMRLRVPTQADFTRLGLRPERVRVVPDSSLARYPVKPLAPPAPTRASDVFFDCGTDWDHWDGKHHWNCQSSASLVRKDVLIAGWMDEGKPWANVKHYGCEDAHFDVWVDPLFITRMYGPGGLSGALAGRSWRGNPPTRPIPVEDRNGDGTPRGVNVNSFQLAGQFARIHGELNCWHVETTGGLWTRHFEGRGPAPAGWLKMVVGGYWWEDERGERHWVQDDAAWFPWNIYAPGGEMIRAGDYVLMRGALWQDHVHSEGGPADSPWEHGTTAGHGGWSEFHPVDWVVKLRPPSVARRPTVAHIGVCTSAGEAGVLTPDYPWIVGPDFPPSYPTSRIGLRSVEELVDNRGFTDPGTVRERRVVPTAENAQVYVKVEGTATRQGRFLGSYVARWRDTDVLDRYWIDDALPAGAVAKGGIDGWNWIGKLPASHVGPRPEDEPYIGTRAHRSKLAAGRHAHAFVDATQRLAVTAGDVLFAHVFLDAVSPPEEVMLEFNDGSWEHRAYWGADKMAYGTNGTPSRRRIGDLPPAGEWVRLEVPAAQVALEGRALTGMGFSLYGGRATWDCAGKRLQREPPACAGLRQQRAAKSAQILGLKAELTRLQKALGSASPSEKPEIIAQIRAINARIAAANDEVAAIKAEMTRLACL
jgi:hypothetical protein